MISEIACRELWVPGDVREVHSVSTIVSKDYGYSRPFGDGARTALTFAATVFRAGQAEYVAKHAEEGRSSTATLTGLPLRVNSIDSAMDISENSE